MPTRRYRTTLIFFISVPEHVYYVAVNKVLDLRNKVVDKRPSRNAGMVVRHF